MEEPRQLPEAPVLERDEGVLQSLLWYVKGLVQPCYSLAFYRQGLKEGLGNAVLFAVFLALLLTAASSIRFYTTLAQLPSAMGELLGGIRSITIANGVASVEGVQPWTVAEGRQFFGIDTTGRITEIDTRQYSEGILLTRTQFHILNEDAYQVLGLRDLTNSLEGPLVIDDALLARIWRFMTGFMMLVVVGGLFLWNFAVRLGYLTVLGFIVWPLVRGRSRGLDFNQVLLTGIYVSVPALYLSWLVRWVGVTCLGWYTLFLLVGWILVLWVIEPPAPLAAVSPGDRTLA